MYGIRTNGVLVYLQRYGVQGHVYLKDRNGLVATPDEDNMVVWREGNFKLLIL